MNKQDEYDWLDDPFNEKKAPPLPKAMSGKSKAAVGIGCLGIIVAISVLGFLLITSLGDLLNTL